MIKSNAFYVLEDLIQGEMSSMDFCIMCAWGAIQRGYQKKEVLEAYEITEEEYDSNVKRVMNL